MTLVSLSKYIERALSDGGLFFFDCQDIVILFSLIWEKGPFFAPIRHYILNRKMASLWHLFHVPHGKWQ